MSLFCSQEDLTLKGLPGPAECTIIGHEHKEVLLTSLNRFFCPSFLKDLIVCFVFIVVSDIQKTFL